MQRNDPISAPSVLPDFSELQDKLRELISTFNDKQASAVKSWNAILMSMVGCYYSLYQAKALLNANRDFENQMKHSLGILNLLKKGKRITANDELTFNSWSVGFHLNNAELRINSALNRLLKVYYGTDKIKYIDEVLRMIKKNASLYNRCKEAISIYEKANKKLGDDRIREKYSDMSREASIARVWQRVNEVKHGVKPIADEEDPDYRWKDCSNALDALVTIFKEFAMDRKVF